MDFSSSNDTKTDESNQAITHKSDGGGEHSTCGHKDAVPSISEESYPVFETLYENVYLGNKKKRVNKEIRRMTCDCSYCPDEIDFVGCGDDCINRLLMIECNNRCPCLEFCSNKKFQGGQKHRVEAFRTERKGWGLRTLEDISANQFVMEYSGEVMGYDEFEKRVEAYDRENRRHYYFMTLRADEIIDATYKGNLSRFINHSCDPNCETQKWTVNGYLRIGFFSVKDIPANTELTFDYKFQRYGKKAQVCYCESQNCCGIIGGEKHTPLKSIISSRPASPAPASSPRRNRRRRLAEQFDDKPLEVEITQLLAGDKGIKTDQQALKLSQFMVRAETTSQRLLLLNALAAKCLRRVQGGPKKRTPLNATVDQSCLRNFVKYQGLSLLWSWMVDLGENSLHLQKKIVQVLKHLPVANLNQVKDTKVLRVISKWAKKPSVSCVPEEETSSSDVDSRGLSPQDALDDASRRETHISSSSDELQNSSKNVETEKSAQNNCTASAAECSTAEQNEKAAQSPPLEDSVFEPGEIRSDEELKPEGDKPEEIKLEELNSEGQKPEELKSEDVKMEDQKSEDLKSESVKPHRLKGPNQHKTSRYNRIVERPGESSEEESPRWSEDDATSSDSESIIELAADLLDQWSSLKEVYRIPKKSTHVVQQEPESTSGTLDGAASDSNPVRTERSTPVVPKMDEDLFKKDEFLSKLGGRDFHSSKSSQRITPTTSADLPSLMSTSYTEDSEGDHDSSKMSIHQRLQNVANTNNDEKFTGWHAKAGARRGNRKTPYPSPRGPQQDWPSRHQTPSQFTAPIVNPSSHPGIPRPNMPPNNQWQPQEPPSHNPYPNTSHGTQGGIPTSVPPPFSLANQNPVQPGQPTYFQSSEQSKPEQTGYQTTWNSNPTFVQDQGAGHVPQGASHVSHGFGQLPPPPPHQSQVTPGQFPPPPNQYPPGYTNQTTPFGYQQSANQNQPYTQPVFNPFIPNQNNPSSNQFPPGFPPPFPTNPATYSLTPSTNVTTTYSMNVNAHPHFGPREQTPGSNVSMVSSTVGGSEAMDIVDPKSEWSGEAYSKTQEVSLPPDWKKAYDGEGRSYYYHVVTRQTQWEPPVADRSPPTPEVGYLGDELDTSMDSSLFSSHVSQDVTMEVVDSTKPRKKPRTPSTPPGSPPKSPVSKYTTAAADTTDTRKGAYSPSSLLQGQHLTPEQRKRRETFRMKLSAVVVNYLNPYHKVDCKIGRITSVPDFKFLARKLTHGVMVKELNRIKDESQLACNDSVKIKTKEYIRNYMQKFGPLYKPS